ncbi:hypothetical protein OIE66_13170 [Nonomuraea sp. NBC_01738]|uniref:hypothetical protein n=1 Tax=Nonomuraea sp. NBC_01738 TaxID=2976003 RepID=UPI002E15AD00|nr:hypothetical protein OIE66_13170 [Nonomuraea sp. NBC_01738]
MNPWQELMRRVEADDDVVGFVLSLSALGRRAIAVQLPRYLAEWEAPHQVAGLRVAGAACLGGAAQVAGWLHRRDLRRVREPREDAQRVLAVLQDRPDDWRRDLAARLVEGLRQPTGPRWRRGLEHQGWDLAAGLVAQTGIDPPRNDAFAAGWAWRLAAGQCWSWMRVPLGLDPLLPAMLPRLFTAEGVEAALTWSLARDRGSSAVHVLAGRALSDPAAREVMLDGCVRRFLAGSGAEPFVALWRMLEPGVAEVPVPDFVRALPGGPSAFAALAAEQLRRADAAGLVPDDLYAEAVESLAFRPERKHQTAALTWIGASAARLTQGADRVDGSLTALAVFFDQGSVVQRDRAVRLAVRLAGRPPEGLSGRGAKAVREAAVRLPGDLRARVEAAFRALEMTA